MLFNILVSFIFLGVAASQVCNGNAALCSRQYSNITFIGTHDSAFVGVLPTDNQLISVAAQLTAGVRFLQAQSHYSNGQLELCHTSCLEKDAGPLTTYLATIKSFLDSNPNEVVTLLLTNGDNKDVSLFGQAIASTGLNNYAYTPPNQLAMADWPTLQEFISAGTRFIMFLDYGANTAEVPYILDEFSYYFETAYDVTDSSFSSCALDRPPGNSGAGLMMIVNHFLDLDIFGIDIPDMAAASKTNSATGSGSIGEQGDLCIATWDRTPNVFLLDYFELGNAFAAQDTFNGL